MKKIINFLIASLKLIFSPILWITASFQGSDGKASGKKITAAFFSLVSGYYVFMVHNSYTLYAFIALLVTILMMWGIISISNIITLTRVLKANGKETEK